MSKRTSLFVVYPALALLVAGTGSALADPAKPADGQGDSAQAAANSKVKYKAGKTLDFEQLLIQGNLRRPEITVVTGNASQGADGLLRLRENFLDRMAADAGEEIQ